MKYRYFAILMIAIFVTTINVNAQTFTGTWSCDYATWDEQPNSTGYNTPSVGVIKPNTFVALVHRKSNSTNFLVGYTNATDSTGRMGVFGYGSALAGYRQTWVSGFDLVEMLEAYDIAASSDSLVYVPNNDVDNNILVFKMSADSVVSTDYRLATGADSLYGIDLDGAKNVYVTVVKPNLPGEVRIYPSIASSPEWAGSHSVAPLRTITMPDSGQIRDVTVNENGTVIYVSNYTLRKIYCFTGSIATGFTQLSTFNVTIHDTLTSSGGTFVESGPWGMNLLKNKNILAVCTAVNFSTGAGYELARLYMLNPNTGAILDTIDCAAWNFMMTGGYSNRPGGTQPRVSGYASPYYVDWDANDGLYTVSYYGWTVDKWSYSETLPTIPLTIVSVRKEEAPIPSRVELHQNFPNPFNPTTTIRFTLSQNEKVTLSVYDINGRLINELISGSQLEPGTYSVTFDASKLASGTYIYTLTTKTFTQSGKMTLIK